MIASLPTSVPAASAGVEKKILAFDVGTSSLRTSLFDLSGVRLAESTAQRKYVLHTQNDGTAELDPVTLLEAAEACFAATLHEPTPLAGVGTSCFWHSLIGTDTLGEPVTPIFTWADSRCKEEAAVLRQELNEREIHAETGCMLRSSYWPAKLRWLRKTRPETFDRVKKWMSPAEWLQWRIAGRATCAIGMATGTGLFDPSRLTWSSRMLDVCGITADQLLPISDEPVPFLGAPWFPAIGDGAASNLGSDATVAGRGAINFGTSAALRVVCDGPRATAPFGLFCYRIDAERTLVGGAISNAGNLRAWCVRELNFVHTAEALEAELARRRLPEHGLLVLPFWNAERAPSWNEEARGTITGFTQATTAVDILQATTEAVYQRIASIAALVERASLVPPNWVLSGGILQSPCSIQRLSNVLGRPLQACVEPEASLRGAAVFALGRLGVAPTPLPLGPICEPEPDAVAAYAAQRTALQKLEDGFNA